MKLRLISGSGDPKPLNLREQAQRKGELREISWSPKEAYPLSSIYTDQDPHERGARIYRFHFGMMETGVVVTIRVMFKDAQSKADAAITYMTTLPHMMCRQGYGTIALQKLLDVFKKENFANVQAVKVTPGSEQFWIKNGFYTLKNITNDFCFGQP